MMYTDLRNTTLVTNTHGLNGSLAIAAQLDLGSGALQAMDYVAGLDGISPEASLNEAENFARTGEVGTLQDGDLSDSIVFDENGALSAVRDHTGADKDVGGMLLATTGGEVTTIQHGYAQVDDLRLNERFEHWAALHPDDPAFQGLGEGDVAQDLDELANLVNSGKMAWEDVGDIVPIEARTALVRGRMFGWNAKGEQTHAVGIGGGNQFSIAFADSAGVYGDAQIVNGFIDNPDGNSATNDGTGQLILEGASGTFFLPSSVVQSADQSARRQSRPR
jgi:hypothetical protein